jgi:hypothetical protein
MRIRRPVGIWGPWWHRLGRHVLTEINTSVSRHLRSPALGEAKKRRQFGYETAELFDDANRPSELTATFSCSVGGGLLPAGWAAAFGGLPRPPLAATARGPSAIVRRCGAPWRP